MNRETLEQKIAKTENAISRNREQYDRLTVERKIERAKQALYDAYVESERSLDKIIDLIRNADEWI
ncbi:MULTISPECIES: hypothetical protein [Blautia]|uniref:hypothetical protein n=1 Tax=Blautia TaxID=572511 RepID=UPI00156FFE35|nr:MULTISPECIES: hypothetical protein [Blautia]MCB6328578.1 hypothetical protein [Blautia faecis]MCB6626683.1 hypothetical protein [Blautia sp. 210702-DFI.1.159]NSG93417.1 hypothetical protein [Blautia faecis]